jgi:hypothetical protein
MSVHVVANDRVGTMLTLHVVDVAIQKAHPH